MTNLPAIRGEMHKKLMLICFLQQQNPKSGQILGINKVFYRQV